MKINIDLIYPVGAIYLSTSAINPSELFGGEWEALEDRFLVGVGSKYAIGQIGGEETHTLTVAEIPSHTHSVNTNKIEPSVFNTKPSSATGNLIEGEGVVLTAYWAYSGTQTPREGSQTGGSGAHNNLPPYLAVYMWKRVA